MSRKIKVMFDVEIPDIEYTDKELEEWIRYEFKDNGSMSITNPFEGHEPEPIWGSFWWDIFN